MRRRWLMSGATAGVLALVGAAVVAGWGPFGSTLTRHEREVVDEVQAGRHAASPVDAARYIDDNIAVLLSPEVAASVDAHDLAHLFEVALDSDDTGAAAFAVVVAGVAEEGAIHVPRLSVVFADAVAAYMPTIDENINDGFPAVDAPASESAKQGYVRTHDFLREVFDNQDAALLLDQALNDYGEAEVARAPADGAERTDRLEDIGHVQEVFAVAQTNAEMGHARRDGNADAVEAAEGAAVDRRAEHARDRAVWLALARFGSSRAPEVYAAQVAADGQPFVDHNGALKPDLTDGDADAFRDWAATQTHDGGLTAEDAGDIASGADEVVSPAGVPFLEDRY